MNNEIVRNLHKVQSDLQRQLSRLNKETDTVKADLDAVGRMLQRYEGQTSLSLPSAESSNSNGTLPSYEDSGVSMTLKDHVLAVLEEHYPKAYRARDVRLLVTKRGYKSTAVSFEGAMFATLSNLNKGGDIEKAGAGLYRYKMQEGGEVTDETDQVET